MEAGAFPFLPQSELDSGFSIHFLYIRIRMDLHPRQPRTGRRQFVTAYMLIVSTVYVKLCNLQQDQFATTNIEADFTGHWNNKIMRTCMCQNHHVSHYWTVF